MSLSAIGKMVGRHESTVAYWVGKHGLVAASRERYVSRGGIPPDTLARLVAAGATVAEIAAECDRSKTTVRHWLRRYGLSTVNESGRRRSLQSKMGRDAGLGEVTMECPRHGSRTCLLDGRGYYRCRRCRSEAVSRRRRKVKEILVAEAGGACRVCGYRASMRALQFHHVDPSTKRLDLSAGGVALSLDTLRIEARKCVLLCGNCHVEVEHGVVDLDEAGGLA
jgi:transposase